MKVLVLAKQSTLENYTNNKLRDLPVTHLIRLPDVRFQAQGFFKSNPEIIDLGDMSQEDIIIYSADYPLDSTLAEIIQKAKELGTMFIELPISHHANWNEKFIVYGEGMPPTFLDEYKIGSYKHDIKIYKVSSHILDESDLITILDNKYILNRTNSPMISSPKKCLNSNQMEIQHQVENLLYFH